MAEHYTKDTIEVRRFCRKCRLWTMHNVAGGRLGACQKCIEKLDEAAKQAAKVSPIAKQTSLF